MIDHSVDRCYVRSGFIAVSSVNYKRNENLCCILILMSNSIVKKITVELMVMKIHVLFIDRKML